MKVLGRGSTWIHQLFKFLTQRPLSMIMRMVRMPQSLCSPTPHSPSEFQQYGQWKMRRLARCSLKVVCRRQDLSKKSDSATACISRSPSLSISDSQRKISAFNSGTCLGKRLGPWSGVLLCTIGCSSDSQGPKQSPYLRSILPLVCYSPTQKYPRHAIPPLFIDISLLADFGKAKNFQELARIDFCSSQGTPWFLMQKKPVCLQMLRI